MAENEAVETSGAKNEAEDTKTKKSNKFVNKNVSPKQPGVDTFIEENPNIEYEQLLNRLKTQNEFFNSLKLKLIELECEECTCNVACCIEQIRCRMEVEKENLQLIVKEIVKFQRDHPDRPWEEIEIATHLSEDNIPDGKEAAMCAAMLKMQHAKENKEQRLNKSG